MDKKKALFAAFVLAVSASTAGCDKKDKNPKIEDSSVTADSFGNYAENDTGEKEFIELSDSDFKTINVTTSIMEEDAPVNVKRIDLSNVEIEPKIPICYRAENVEKYINDHNVYYCLDDKGYVISSSYGIKHEENALPVYDWHDYIDKPVDGYICNSYLRGKDCFLYIRYDSNINTVDCYNNALLKYDTESGKTAEIYSWASDDLEEESFGNCVFSSDSVFIMYLKRTENEGISGTSWTIKKVDLDTGEVTTALEETNSMSYFDLNCDNIGNVYYKLYLSDEDNNSITKIYKYDEESKKFVLLSEVESNDVTKSSELFNGKLYSLVKPENKRRLDIVCDSYRIGTNVTNAKIAYADDDCFILKNDDNLNVYNITKMEHYVLDVKGMGGQVVMSDGILFFDSGDSGFAQPLYCMIPELGLTYKVGDNGIYENMTCINGEIRFDGKHREDTTYKILNGLYENTHSFDVVDSTYTLTVKG